MEWKNICSASDWKKLLSNIWKIAFFIKFWFFLKVNKYQNSWVPGILLKYKIAFTEEKVNNIIIRQINKA